MKKIVYCIRKISSKPNGKPDLLRRIAIWLCEKFGGHEASSDVGYSGGCMLDVWCKHCDYLYQMPIKEKNLTPDFKNLMGIIDNV